MNICREGWTKLTEQVLEGILDFDYFAFVDIKSEKEQDILNSVCGKINKSWIFGKQRMVDSYVFGEEQYGFYEMQLLTLSGLWKGELKWNITKEIVFLLSRGRMASVLCEN